MDKDAVGKDAEAGEGEIVTILLMGPHPCLQLVEYIQQEDMGVLRRRHPIQTNGIATRTCASVVGLISHIGPPVQLSQRKSGVWCVRSDVTVPTRRHTLMQRTISVQKE